MNEMTIAISAVSDINKPDALPVSRYLTESTLSCVQTKGAMTCVLSHTVQLRTDNAGWNVPITTQGSGYLCQMLNNTLSFSFNWVSSLE